MLKEPVYLNEKKEEGRAGFFGPGSHIWLNHQYFIRAIGYPVAVLIVFTDPVAYEIISSYVRTPKLLKERLVVTRKYAFDFVFADRRTALNASNALRYAHQKIKYDIDGVLRSPLEPELMLWVFAALYYSSKKINELLLMNIPFNEATYKEYKILGQLYGVSEQHLPNTMDDFDQYWNKALNERLAVSEECKMYIISKFQLSIVDILFNHTQPAFVRFLFKPLDQFIRIFCIYCLPQKIIEAFDLQLTTRQRAWMKYILKCVRFVHVILPKRFTIEHKVRMILKRY